MAFFVKNQERRTAAKLARLSAEGRKRENAALFAVLFLLFLLSAAMVSWISIHKQTEKEQRFDAYGEWKAAFYSMDEEQAASFINNPQTTKSGVSRLGGSIARADAVEQIEELKAVEKEVAEIVSEAESYTEKLTLQEVAEHYLGLRGEREYRSYVGICGTVGTIDAGFAEMGRISMEAGSFPKEPDEIAMTRPMLLGLGLGEELGQSIDLVVISNEGDVEEGTWRLSGILEIYGTTWKTKGCPLVSAVVSEEALAAITKEPLCNVLTDVDGIVGDTRFIYKMSEVPMEVVERFAFNDAAYDFWGRTDAAYIWIMLVTVALTAMVTVFQITLAQMRKRSRQAGLLKAIGATKDQVRRIFLREVTGVLWRAALPGTILGAALVPAVLWGSGLAKRRRLYYSLNVPLLLGAAALGCLVVWLGALLSVWKGSRIPVRGELPVKTVRLRPMKKNRKYRTGRLVAGRGDGSFRVLMVLSLAAAAASVFLAFYQMERELSPYRYGEKKLYYRIAYNHITDRYGEKPDDTVLEQFARIPGVEEVYTQKNGVEQPWNFYISYEGIETCELERLRKNWDASPYSYIWDQPYREEEELAMVHLMGLYTGWESNLKGIGSLVTEGEFDRETFEAGEEVLLFLPPYREMDNRAVTGDINRLAFHTDKRYRAFYEKEECVKPGDTITLVVKEKTAKSGQEHKGDAEIEYDGTREVSVRVGGIIRYLPRNTENLLWDEACQSSEWGADVLQPYTVIADSGLVNKLRLLYQELLVERALQKSAGEPEEEYGRDLPPEFELESIGRNSKPADTSFEGIVIRCDTSASESTQSTIESLAEFYGMYVSVPDEIRAGGKTIYESWREEYREAYNRSLLYLTAAVAAVFVFVCLLLKSVNERLLEDRRRLGIFQAMGIRRQEIKRGYLLKGLGSGILALIPAHGALIVSAVWQSRAAAAGLSPYRFINGREALLYRFDLWFGAYDWRLHGLACVLILAFAMAVYIMPLRGVWKNSPVENIRELGE